MIGQVQLALLVRRIAVAAWIDAQRVIEPGREDFEQAVDRQLAEAAERGELEL